MNRARKGSTTLTSRRTSWSGTVGGASAVADRVTQCCPGGTVSRTDRAWGSGPELREVGRGARWLVLRSWDHSNDEQRARLRLIFRLNGKLARAYQLVEELRAVLRAPDRKALYDGIWRILRRTERRDNVPMRKLHHPPCQRDVRQLPLEI